MTVEATYIEAADGLDPIAVYVENLAPGQGRMVVQCYARAWTAYWGGMGASTMQQFVVAARTDYVVDNMLCELGDRILKRRMPDERRYLARIVESVKAAFARDVRRPVADDALLAQARAIIIEHQIGSTSLVQRMLGIGWSQAARLLEMLQAAGVVGPITGKGGRRVLIGCHGEKK